jgi:RND family efflux transporter MFP subunit
MRRNRVLIAMTVAVTSMVLSPLLAQAQTKPAQPGLDALDIRAQLSPKRYTTLAAEIGARINRIAFKEGERFKAGQMLVSLDCSVQAAQRDRARAALNAAETAWTGNKKMAEYNAVGQVELDTSRAEVDKMRAELNFNNATLAKCGMVAPFSGRVAEQKAREGQYLQPGQAVLDILDDSSLELEFIVPSKWLAWLQPGYKFQVLIDETRKAYPARIQRIGARIDPVSQSVKAIAVIDGQFADLIAGMSGKIELTPPAK